MINLNLKNENGRSMIEMLGVLAIIGVLSVGGIAGYSKAMTKYRINKAIEQITLIAGNVRTFFASQGNYEGLSSSSATGKAIIKKAKLVPDEMIEYNADGTIKNITSAFGGNVSLYSDGGNRTGSAWVYNHKAFCIGYSIDLDYDVCIELLSQDWTTAGVKGIMLYGPSYDSAMMPISIETAVDKCSSWINALKSYRGSAGIIMFYFYMGNCKFSGPQLRCS